MCSLPSSPVSIQLLVLVILNVPVFETEYSFVVVPDIAPAGSVSVFFSFISVFGALTFTSLNSAPASVSPIFVVPTCSFAVFFRMISVEDVDLRLF